MEQRKRGITVFRANAQIQQESSPPEFPPGACWFSTANKGTVRAEICKSLLSKKMRRGREERRKARPPSRYQKTILHAPAKNRTGRNKLGVGGRSENQGRKQNTEKRKKKKKKKAPKDQE